MCIEVIESPQSQSVCEGGTVEFECVIMFPSGTMVDSAIWPTESITDSAATLPGHDATCDIGNLTAPANITKCVNNY